MKVPWDWPDARGWIGLGAFALTVMILWMLLIDTSLRNSEFFKTIATVLISNSWIAVVSWAYSATKGGGELADKNAALVEKVMPTTNGSTTIEVEKEENKK